MATIKIQRTNELNNRLRDFNIFIDGKYAGKIANAETKNFITPGGQHSVTAKIDCCSSPDILIDIKDDEAISLQTGGFKNGSWIMPIIGAIIATHFILKITLNIQYLVFLVIPAFIFLIYYLTVARKKFLTLTKISND